MILNFNDLRPYQKACIYQLENSLQWGKKKLFVNMPTGSGKLFTIFHFINYYCNEDDKILFLHNRRALLGQSLELINFFPLKGKVSVSTFDNISLQEINDSFDYIIVDVDDIFAFKRTEEYKTLLNTFDSVVISYFSIFDNSYLDIVNYYGGLDYSINIAELLLNEYSTLSSDENESNEIDIDNNFISIIENNQKVKQLICNLICENKKSFIDGNEVMEDVIAIIAGFFPLGSIIGVTIKHIYRFIQRKIIRELKNILSCYECNNGLMILSHP